MKRLLLVILFFNTVINSAYSQQSTYAFYGQIPPYEGSTVTYTLQYSAHYSMPLSGLNAAFSAVNGQVIAEQGNMHNNQPVTVTIHWDCMVTQGEIDVTIYGEYGSQAIHFYDHIEYPLPIITGYTDPNFCTSISPQEQNVMFSQLPDIITVTNCSPSCENTYGFTYEWVFADIANDDPYALNANWQPVLNLDGSPYIGINYQPPLPPFQSMRAYRRLTIYDDPSSTTAPPQQIRTYSDIAFVRNINELEPGVIYTATPVFQSYHNTPIITTIEAFGGMCIPLDYVYTWQSTNATGIWQDIGTGETFPPNTEEISYTKKYRRKIECGGEIKYTNELTIYFNYITENTENLNYVRESDVLVPGRGTWNEVDGELHIGEKLQNTTYLDGFGRPIQKVSRETGTPIPGTNKWFDNVEFFKYDGLGRQPNGYLPYATLENIGKYKPEALSEQRVYYENINPDYSNYTFSISTFDGSPLNRVKNTRAPGQAWHHGQGTSTDFDYPLNKESEKIPVTYIGFNETDEPKLIDYYKNNTLIRSKTTNESNSISITYTTKEGLLVLKKVQLKPTMAGSDEYTMDGWICTYYVYDDFGRLRYTIEPEAVKYFRNVAWDFSAADAHDILNALCFKYFYDERGNTVLKKTPGNAELKMAYDMRNRPVLSQDGNMANTSTGPAKCNLSLYDDQDRPTLTALYNFNQGHDFDYYKNAIEQAAPNDVAAIFQADLTTPSVATVLKYLYYDDYSFASAKQFDNGFHNTTAYPTGHPGAQAIGWSKRIKGFATGSSTLVLDGSNTYLNTTTYYDDEARPVQTLTDNFLQGADIVTNQYQWDGRLLSTDAMHTGGSNYNRFSIVTKNSYDKIGRVKLIEKIIGTNALKKIVAYDYDNLGRVITKHLSPDYLGTNGEPDIETLNYSYNLQGKLEGVNKDYALKTPGAYNKYGSTAGKFFGYYLGYDLKPENGNLFTNQLLTGQIAAQVWNTLGDDEQRKYEYLYDKAGRLLGAGFFQRKDAGTAWDNTKLDFSVGGNSTPEDGSTDKITYDLNGNIGSMWQKGVLIGNNSIVKVDALSYTYEKVNSTGINTNKLLSVTDGGQLAVVNPNENLGDFKDEQPNPDPLKPDYVYDENGNLLFDNNKGIKDVPGGVPTPLNVNTGILYNHLDKPEVVRIEGKGTVKITYDADGNKLRRLFESDVTGETKCTVYANGYVYTATYANGGTPIFTAPAYINFEEGRIRVINNSYTSDPPATPPLTALDYVSIYSNLPIPDITSTTAGVFDYYIKDNLQNVRMIVTEEEHTTKATCTMEQYRQPNELPGFAYPSGALMNKNNIPPGTGNATTSVWSSAGSGDVAQLSKNGDRVGPSTLQKVMAGDEVSAQCSYFYNEIPANINETSSLPSLIADGLVNAIFGGTAATASVKAQVEGINNLPLSIGNAIKDIVGPDEEEAGPTSPKAYLTMLFFDERFSFVSSEQARVSQAGDGADPLPLTRVKAPKNGYVFIYVSNESDIPVYFDDLVINHKRGELIEENHYYPYGLKIATISSVKIGDAGNNEGELKNNHKYQGEYNEFDEELGWNDFTLRSYDPQIGRWLQADPYDEFSSAYLGMGDDPVNIIDITGGGVEDWVSFIVNEGGREITKAVWSNDVTDQASAEEYVKSKGGKNAHYIGKNGFWTSNENGIENWMLLNNGKVFKTSGFRDPIGMSPPIEEVKSYTPTKNFAQKWDGVNSSWFKHTPLGVASNILYGLADNVKIFGSSIANGWRNATDLKGENLINTHGAKAAESSRMMSAVTTISLITPLGAIENGVANESLGALDGSFSITEFGWQGYPRGIPRPKGPFRLLQGEEYATARTAANKANGKISDDLGLRGKVVDVHEIIPVKFGGSPTNINNKMILDRTFHQSQVSPFWKKIQNGIQ